MFSHHARFSSCAPRRIAAAFALALALAAAPAARAQKAIDDLVRQVGQQYAEGYAAPLADLLSAGFNSGQFQTADEGGLHVYVSVQAAGIAIPTSARTFTRTITVQTDSSSFYPPELRNQRLSRTIVDAPTVLGGDAPGRFLIDTTINGQHYQIGSLPPGIDRSFVFPLLVPHLEIGPFYNTELLLRGIPAIKLSDDVGSVSFYGIGLRHSLSRFLPLLPVDVAVQAMYQHLAIGSIVTVNAWSAAALASYSLPAITLYGGLQLETASLALSYQSTDTTSSLQHVDLTLSSAPAVRATLGATIKLFLIHLNVQATLGNYVTLGAGLGVRIPPSLM